MELLNYIADATVYRIKEGRKRIGRPEKTPNTWFADDDIALLSLHDYERFILPVHKRMLNALTTGEGPNTIHLCGDATRHFAVIRDELNVKSFDTGYPVRHGALVREMGPDVEILGGPRADLLLMGGSDAIRGETRRILGEVKPHTRKFVMKEANALCPRTPPVNILAMYDTVKEHGWYE